MFSYLKEIDEKSLNELVSKVLDIFEASHDNKRMITSILAFLDRLMSSGCVQSIFDDPESDIPDRMLILLKREIKFRGTTKLITSSMKVFCQLLQVGLLIIFKTVFNVIFYFVETQYLCQIFILIYSCLPRYEVL